MMSKTRLRVVICTLFINFLLSLIKTDLRTLKLHGTSKVPYRQRRLFRKIVPPRIQPLSEDITSWIEENIMAFN